MNGLSQGLVTPFFIPFFILVYQVSMEQMSIYTTLSGLIAATSLLLSPRIERFFGFLGGIYSTRGATVVLALLFPFIRLLPVSVGIYLMFPSLRIAAIPVQQSAMMDMIDETQRGGAFGVNQGARLLFSSIGTIFTGYEFQLSEIHIPFMLYAAAMGLNLILYHRFFSSYKGPIGKD